MPPSAAGIDRKDAYLDWGLATQFRYFVREQHEPTRTTAVARRALRFEAGSIGLLVEWNSVEAAVMGLRVVTGQGLNVPRVYAGDSDRNVPPQRVWSLSVPLPRVEQVIEAITPLARNIELAAPVAGPVDLLQLAQHGQSDTPILAGVLDDGCAFANTRFMQAMETRVLWLWNQDGNAKGLPLDQFSGPTANCDFGYGGQWSQQGLDNLITTLQGRQAPIYARAGLPTLRRAAAHGPHVTDLLCGAEDWQIAFVQFPQAGIDDPSGRWLARFALDGLHYVLECAGPHTSTIVVNLSWGPQTGRHDGRSPLEVAIDDLVNQQAQQQRRLIVALPAGNSFSAQAHASISYMDGGGVNWIVPPDGYTPAFLEMWWPEGVQPSDARLRVTPPGGPPVDIVFGAPLIAPDWFATVKSAGGSTMALLVVHPTEERNTQHRGQHGKWTLEFPPADLAVPGQIDVYVARADHNMGAARRAKASFLTDAALEANRFAAPDDRYLEAPGSVVRRHGTLNGLATGAQSYVASGYRFRDRFSRFQCAPYSSAGPSRDPDPRLGPNFSCATDVSLAIAGIRATGVRSGTTIRLIGTSTAAPQMGRQLANNDLHEFDPVPYPDDADERIGAACLSPDDGVIHRE